MNQPGPTLGQINSIMIKILTSNTLTTQALAVLSIIGSIIGFSVYGITLGTVGLTIFGYFLYVCLGVVVTFHRNLTHRGYSTYPAIEYIGAFLGSMANTGSPIVWSAIHIKHHLHSDKVGDPHSPWMLGWKVFLLEYPVDDKIKWRIKHIIANPFYRMLHKYYYAFLIGWSLLLFAIGGWYLMIFLHWAPIVIAAIMSNIVNYAGHKESWWGSFKTYKLSDHSCNNWIWALPSWGEAWHNNHHRWPRRYTTSEKWWQVDISGWVIKLIKV
jgi:stearoyl-CoA desaturase (delta-9 desaturase)